MTTPTPPESREVLAEVLRDALNTSTLMHITGKAISVQDGCGMSVDGSLLRDSLIDAILPYLRRADRSGTDDGLDVERLAEALFRTQEERLHGGADGLGLGTHEADAGAIAAEYARLSAAAPTPEGME
jgi:hypothetical protein